MTNWRSAGHAIRRRSGAKSSHLDALGTGGRVNLPTPEEALAGMARIGSPRVPMGMDGITEFVNVSGNPQRGELRARQGAQAGDPTPPTGVRVNVSQEKLGAAYRVKAVTPPMMSPEAGATQANGRILATSVGREDSFGDGIYGAHAGY